MTRADLDQWVEDTGIVLLCYDEFDHCIVGIGQRFNDHFVVYDLDRVMTTLRKQMSQEDAEEHFDFNVNGGWVGEHTPCFVQRKL